MWSILLNDFNAKQLSKYKLFIYSTKTLGRNPYVVADLSDVMHESLKLNDNEFLSTRYDTAADYTSTGYEIQGIESKIVVSGT